MTSDPICHLFLTQADDQEQACRKVDHFLDHTELIRYEATTIRRDEIVQATVPAFWQAVEKGMAANRASAEGLIKELTETGVSRLSELSDLPQGYPSKVLHTLVHILDGFIGVDSAFYNLLEDSHWVSERLRQVINEKPAQYWLVPVVPGRLKYTVFHAMTDQGPAEKG